jgi:asparagine synthase (glutamine-hydrolysing)
MCGISGTVRQTAGGLAVVQGLLSSQARRGPDHSQLVDREIPPQHLIFGHNRLAIVDLDPRSNQPFVDPENQQMLVYNGEIYNHLELRQELQKLGVRFSTSSDTEVLLKAYQQWGLDGLTRFNGFFAFALYDPKTQRTILARDRYGVKPLYYHWQDGNLTFASNPAALASKVGARINYRYLETGLSTGLYERPTGLTAYEGIFAVHPGEYLLFDGAQMQRQRFYDLNERVATLRPRLAQQSLAENLRELEQLLLSAVELRLRADVPTTLSLSGGLDSGLCAALIRQCRTGPLEAFTFANSSLPGNEARLAQLTAERFDFKLHYVPPDAAHLQSLFEDTLEAQGVPFGEISGLAQNTIFAAVHRAHYKVSIGGQGADEAFAGYRKFQLAALSELRQRGALPKLLREGLGTSWTLLRELNSPQNYFYNFRRLYRSPSATFFARQLLQGAAPARPQSRTLSERQIEDVTEFSLPTLLRYEDGNSMFHSIESRMPFLDYRVMEFGLALPLEHKVHGGFGKYILRKLAEPHLPSEIVWDRTKRAFSLTPNWWLGSGLGANLYRQVEAQRERLTPLLSAEAIQQIRAPEFFLNANHIGKISTLLWLIRELNDR